MYTFLNRAQNKPPPYSFKHEVSLTNNVTKFKMAVKNSKITSNIDPPEAGLDALAQALLCDGEEQEDGTIRYET